MATTIEWTDETWNPTGGCDRISPGCAHCYAKAQWDMRHKAFLAGKKMPVQYAQPFEVLQMFEDRLLEPLSWRAPRRVFVNSVSDLFHADVPDAFIDKVFAVMALAPRHTFQVLTKRPERMRDYVARWADMRGPITAFAVRDDLTFGTLTGELRVDGAVHCQWPLPNVWLGVSVENQRFADERIPLLLQTPAAVRFISAEPLLGPVDLTELPSRYADNMPGAVEEYRPLLRLDALRGGHRCGPGNFRDTPHLDWVIVGGESGPGARPFDLAWARSIVQQCKAAGVPVFVKQLGTKPMRRCGMCQYPFEGQCRMFGPSSNGHDWDGMLSMHLRDKKGGAPSEWPEDLRVREFPEARV